MSQAIAYRFSKRQNNIILLLIKIFDTVGYFFYKPGEFNHRYTWKTLGIVMPSHIGDMVLSQPLFLNIKKAFPGKKIVAIVGKWNFEIVKHYFDVDEIIEYSAPWHSRGGKRAFTSFLKGIRKIKVDLILETRGDLRDLVAIKLFSGTKKIIGYREGGLGFLVTWYVRYPLGMHEVERYLQLSDKFGCERSVLRPTLTISKKDTSLPELKKPYVIIHIGVGASARRWDDEKFAELILRLARENLNVVVIGNRVDGERYQKNMDSKIPDKKNIDLLFGKTNFIGAIQICGECSLFVGLESGFTHIATALGVKVLALYSAATDPAVWGPVGMDGQVNVMRMSPSCQICGKLECDNNVCMKEISVDAVMKEIDKIDFKYN